MIRFANCADGCYCFEVNKKGGKRRFDRNIYTWCVSEISYKKTSRSDKAKVIDALKPVFGPFGSVGWSCMSAIRKRNNKNGKSDYMLRYFLVMSNLFHSKILC